MSTEPTNRRGFLIKGLTLAGLGAVGAGVSWIFGSVWTAASRLSSQRWVQIAPLDQFSPDTLTPFAEYSLAIVRSPRRVGAISLECTHLGCLVTAIDRGFFCPCHGSRFGPLGEVYSGPATTPLPWYRVANRDGRIWVHLGRKLQGPLWLEVPGNAGRSPAGA
jgi:cytochrome b6-f complex iron-sulfur subunit